MQEIIDEIMGYHRERNFVMEQRKRTHLALSAFLRMSLGWRKDLPEVERKDIANQALEMAEGVEDDHPLHAVIASSLASRKPFDKIEKDATKQMEKLAKHLQVWEAWGKGVLGFGAVSLAVIIGEAGDLSNYPTHSHLWKRMGLGLLDGVRQGALRKSASADEWKAHGYNPKRRSKSWTLQEPMIKAQVRKVLSPEAISIIEQLQNEIADLKADKSAKARIVSIRKQIEKVKKDGDTGERCARGTYGEYYLRYKARITKMNADDAYSELAATIAARLKKEGKDIPSENLQGRLTAKHIDNRAKRAMEKKLLRDLWKEWRKATMLMPEEAKKGMPSVYDKAA
jgi:hypothetical protein